MAAFIIAAFVLLVVDMAETAKHENFRHIPGYYSTHDRVQGVWSTQKKQVKEYGKEPYIAVGHTLPPPDNINIGRLRSHCLNHYEKAMLELGEDLTDLHDQTWNVTVFQPNGYVVDDEELHQEIPRLKPLLDEARKKKKMPKHFMDGTGAGGLLGFYTGSITIGDIIPTTSYTSQFYNDNHYREDGMRVQQRAIEEAGSSPNNSSLELSSLSAENQWHQLSKREDGPDSEWIDGVKGVHAIIFRFSNDDVTFDQARWFQGVNIVASGKGDAFFMHKHWTGMGFIEDTDSDPKHGMKYGKIKITLPQDDRVIEGRWMAAGRDPEFAEFPGMVSQTVKELFSLLFYTVQIIRQQANF